MDATLFKQIREQLPMEIARNNTVLGEALGVSHHSISTYQNLEGDLPDYISIGILMLRWICMHGQHQDFQAYSSNATVEAYRVSNE